MSTVVRSWSGPAGVLDLLFAAALGNRGANCFVRELWAPDEARFAHVSQELSRKFTPHPFRLGGKRLIAAHWGTP